MTDRRIIPKTLRSGQLADAIIEDYRSPTSAWYAEMTQVTPDLSQAMPLSDKDGDYIPARNIKPRK